MSATELRERVRFERRVEADDGYGNTRGDWIGQFTVAARIMPLRGGEAVIAARLEGTQPAIVTVYADARTRTVTPDWRIVDARAGTVYAVRTVTLRESKDYVDLLCEAGVAA